MKRQHPCNIFAKGDPTSKQFHSTMDAVYKQLRLDGIGADTHYLQGRRKPSLEFLTQILPVHALLNSSRII